VSCGSRGQRRRQPFARASSGVQGGQGTCAWGLKPRSSSSIRRISSDPGRSSVSSTVCAPATNGRAVRCIQLCHEAAVYQGESVTDSNAWPRLNVAVCDRAESSPFRLVPGRGVAELSGTAHSLASMLSDLARSRWLDHSRPCTRPRRSRTPERPLLPNRRSMRAHLGHSYAEAHRYNAVRVERWQRQGTASEYVVQVGL
jgi:hypothetical protein